jgi:hypothetical protein
MLKPSVLAFLLIAAPCCLRSAQTARVVEVAGVRAVDAPALQLHHGFAGSMSKRPHPPPPQYRLRQTACPLVDLFNVFNMPGIGFRGGDGNL